MLLPCTLCGISSAAIEAVHFIPSTPSVYSDCGLSHRVADCFVTVRICPDIGSHPLWSNVTKSVTEIVIKSASIRPELCRFYETPSSPLQNRIEKFKYQVVHRTDL